MRRWLWLLLAVGSVAWGYEYRYVECEGPSTTAGSGLRKEGFTSWMRHPSQGAVMVLDPSSAAAYLEYPIKALPPGEWHVFVRGLAWAEGAAVDVLWDGQKVGRTAYPVPGTALAWSKEVGVVSGGGDHTLRLANVAGNRQAPYLDTVLLTTQPGYRPSDQDQDFRSFVTPLPTLTVAGQAATVTPAPGQAGQGEVSVLSAESEALGLGPIKLSLRLRNARPAARTLRVTAGFDGAPASAEVALPAGGEATASLAPELGVSGRVPLRIELAEGGQGLLQGEYALTAPPPVTVALAETAIPRGTAKVDWSARFTASPEVAATMTAELAVRGPGGGDPLHETVVAGHAPAATWSLPTADLPLGRYQVTSRWRWRGKVVDEATRDLFIYPPAEAQPWEPVKRVDVQAGTLRLNGKPFLGRLLYHAAPSQDVREHGYNLIQCFGGDPDPRASIQNHLDTCAQVGLWGTVALFNNRFLLAGDHFDLPHLRQTVEQFREHPALLAWDLIDEPDAGVPPAAVAEAAKLVRELDPNHPVWVNLCFPDKLRDYLASQDIWSYDHYPLHSPQGPAGYFPYLQVSDTLRGSRVIGSVMQTYAPTAESMPTPDELRCGTWLHVLHDHRFLGYYSYYDGPPAGCLARDPALWSYTRALNAELADLAPTILAEPGFKPVETGRPTEQVQAGSKTHGGQYLLVLVNLTAQPQPVTAPVALGELIRRETGERVRVTDGKLSLSLQPYEVQLYQGTWLVR